MLALLIKVMLIFYLMTLITTSVVCVIMFILCLTIKDKETYKKTGLFCFFVSIMWLLYYFIQ